MTTALAILGLAIGLVVVAWLGTRMLRSGDMSSSGAADMFANFIDVFDPSRARADRDLAEEKHKGEVAPSPDPLDTPLVVDLRRGRATVRRGVRHR